MVLITASVGLSVFDKPRREGACLGEYTNGTWHYVDLFGNELLTE